MFILKQIILANQQVFDVAVIKGSSRILVSYSKIIGVPYDSKKDKNKYTGNVVLLEVSAGLKERLIAKSESSAGTGEVGWIASEKQAVLFSPRQALWKPESKPNQVDLVLSPMSKWGPERLLIDPKGKYISKSQSNGCHQA